MKRNNVILAWVLFVALALVEGSSVNTEAEDGDVDVADSSGPDFSNDIRLNVQYGEGVLERREEHATSTLQDREEVKGDICVHLKIFCDKGTATMDICCSQFNRHRCPEACSRRPHLRKAKKQINFRKSQSAREKKASNNGNDNDERQ